MLEPEKNPGQLRMVVFYISRIKKFKDLVLDVKHFYKEYKQSKGEKKTFWVV